MILIEEQIEVGFTAELEEYTASQLRVQVCEVPWIALLMHLSSHTVSTTPSFTDMCHGTCQLSNSEWNEPLAS